MDLKSMGLEYTPERIEKVETLLKNISEMFLDFNSVYDRKFYKLNEYFVKLETNILFDVILVVKKEHTDVEALFKIYYSKPNTLIYDTKNYKMLHMFGLRSKMFLEELNGRLKPKNSPLHIPRIV
jgi:hypothetical protein